MEKYRNFLLISAYETHVTRGWSVDAMMLWSKALKKDGRESREARVCEMRPGEAGSCRSICLR